MPPAAWIQAELQEQRDKLSNSYQELLDEFNSKDLRTVGNYTIGRLIGKGSFGKVYLALHKLTNGSKVVLKSANKNDPNLAREIHHHRQFVHPHIARLYEVIVTEDLVWLVLEWCPGDELYNHLLNNGRMEESQVQKVFTQLAGAVSYVHAKGCVHRDLKLENILLDKNGNVKLVDFGFTREYQGSTSYLQTWCGTICYSAPEMIKGEKYAGERVDVWSLGIILYALLVGELPYDDDDESLTKTRILKEDPQYPDHFPTAAKELCSKLLSKRPLLRPSLADVLRHPFLSDHAPQQQEILKLQQPLPFTTPLEKETLERMRSAGVNIDTVIEHVLAQRCDSLAGWWTLLIEKEERKARRRERRRKDKEAEEKKLRRLSAASGRLLTAPGLREINEEEQTTVLIGNPPKTRGRKTSRSNASSLPPVTPDLANIQEHRTPTPTRDGLPGSREKDPARSTSSTRRRPLPPPKESFSRRPRAVSRHSSSMLRTVQNNAELLGVPPANQQRKKLYQQPLRAQLTRIKSWFVDMPKRTKSPGIPKIDLEARPQAMASPDDLRRRSTAELIDMRKASMPPRPDVHTRATYPARPRLSTTSSHGSTSSVVSRAQNRRVSLSPQPLTPRSTSFRRRSGIGGRKSTSSSVSSVRSIHVHHPSGISHSKASSTSSASNSIASPKISHTRSPHTSVKIIPSTPGNSSTATGTLPSSIRVQRRAPPGGLGSLPSFSDIATNGALSAASASATSSPFSNIGPQSPGMHAVFARGKRKVFKGPTGLGSSPRNRVATPSNSGSASRDASVARGGAGGEDKGFAITEEDEEEEEEEGEGSEAGGVQAKRMESIGMNNEISRMDFVHENQARGLAAELESELELEVEEVDTFSPASEMPGDAGDGYFADFHAPDILVGVGAGDKSHVLTEEDEDEDERDELGLGHGHQLHANAHAVSLDDDPAATARVHDESGETASASHTVG